MLQNAYFLAKIGADTAENEQHFAEIAARAVASARPSPPASPGAAAPAGASRRQALGPTGLAYVYSNFVYFIK